MKPENKKKLLGWLMLSPLILLFIGMIISLLAAAVIKMGLLNFIICLILPVILLGIIFLAFKSLTLL